MAMCYYFNLNIIMTMCKRFLRIIFAVLTYMLNKPGQGVIL